jgi:hypothetical protein
MQGVRVKPDAVLGNGAVKVEWENDHTLWQLALSERLDNIWFYATRTIPMFYAIRRNESGSLPFDLPRFGPDDILFAPQKGEYFNKEWHNNFRQALLGFDGRVEYTDGEWWSQLSSTNVRCFRRAVISGVFPYVVRRAVANCRATACVLCCDALPSLVEPASLPPATVAVITLHHRQHHNNP